MNILVGERDICRVLNSFQPEKETVKKRQNNIQILNASYSTRSALSHFQNMLPCKHMECVEGQRSFS